MFCHTSEAENFLPRDVCSKRSRCNICIMWFITLIKTDTINETIKRDIKRREIERVTYRDRERKREGEREVLLIHLIDGLINNSAFK